MTGISHGHWEIESVCPQCGKVNLVSLPVGERVIQIHCEHCAHGYEYIHIVKKPKYIEDQDEKI